MSQSPDAPARRFLVGAATPLAELDLNRDWFVDANRDIELNDAVSPENLDSPGRQAAYAERANALLAGHTGRRGIHGPFMGMSIGSPDPAFQQLVARRFIESIRFGATFGATHMVIHSPFHGWVNPFLFAGKGSLLALQIDWIRRTLDPVIPVAEEHGLTLAIENIFDPSIVALLETARTIDHPNVRLSLDVGHAQLTVPHGGMTPDQYVLEAGELLAHVHLQDNDGLSDRHWAAGDGIVPFRAIFESLRAVDGDPRLIVELKKRADIQRSAAYLESLGAAR